MTAPLALLTQTVSSSAILADTAPAAVGGLQLNGANTMPILLIVLAVLALAGIGVLVVLLGKIGKLNKQVALLVERVTPAVTAIEASAPEISSARNAAKNCVELQVRTNELLEWLGTKDNGQ